MKKVISVIMIMLLVFAFTGCKEEKEPETAETVLYTQETGRALADETITQTVQLEQLSEEDKAVKSEIAKHVNTTVDFRNSKQEKITNTTYDLTFSEIDVSSGYKEITYENNNNDKFRYNAETGKLCYANIKSAIKNKTKDSITLKTAETIAEKYATSNCNIGEYTLDLSVEGDTGYEFSYTRYICGYQTTDTIEITVGFDGEIIYIINNTDVFCNVDISKITVNEAWVNSKIESVLSSNSNEKQLCEDTIRISAENEKAILQFSVLENNVVSVCHFEIESGKG